jgi:hypothetical protein
MNEMQCALEAVYMYKTFHDLGLIEFHRNELPEHVDDYDGSLCYEALFFISEAVWSNYSDYEQVETMYFSHPDIMEYYRLCRVYGKKHGIKLKNNPYMQAAADYVRGNLDQPGCYTCSYHLQTKVNHEWAGGIVFRMWPEFSGHLALLVMLRRIFRFYTEKLHELKTSLASGAVITENGEKMKEAA